VALKEKRSRLRSTFIGKGGTIIKQVQDENGVIIVCERDRSTVRISGKEEAVSKAVKAKKDLLST
jgi:polyribonucleotide nucleotidyltransferase